MHKAAYRARLSVLLRLAIRVFRPSWVGRDAMGRQGVHPAHQRLDAAGSAMAARRSVVHLLGAVDAARKERCALLHLAARIFAAAKDI